MNSTDPTLQQKRDVLVREEQLRLVFGQSMKGVFGGYTAGLLLVWVFWSVSSPGVLIGWLVLMLAIAALRTGFYVNYLKREPDSSAVRWERIFLLGTFLHASAWGVGWWLLIPVEGKPEYTMIAALWLIGLSAASFSAYIVHLPSMLAFFVPVVLPGIVRVFLTDGPMDNAIALGLCLYSVVVLTSMLPVYRAVVAAIRLNSENAYEIAERKKAEAKLLEISIRDGLTGLATRRHFDEELASELQRAKRTASPISLMLIDIDSFKSLNDTRGHVVGDACLRQVAQLINVTGKRPGDIAARYGGEEFVVILPNTELDQARNLAELLRSGVEALGLNHPDSQVEGSKVITVSIGVATITPERDSVAADLIEPADKALYRAKANGRNRIEVA